MNDWESYWKRVAAQGYINYTPELLTAIRSVGDLAGRRILEVGGGTGGNASWLAAQGAQVYLVDISPTALEISRGAAREHGVELRIARADGYALPYPNGFFDMIFHVGFLHLFRQPEPLVREQHRVLKTGGYLLVDVPQRYNLYTLWKHVLILLGRWQYGGWETAFSYRGLGRLLERAGFGVANAYSRGYYPAPIRVVRNLQKIEDRLFGGRKVLPPEWWLRYESLWERFERSQLSLYSLMDIGVCGRKLSMESSSVGGPNKGDGRGA